MARKPKHEEHENHERWLISYADFITLLFAFFVVMYSVSSINEGKYRVLSDSIVAAFRSSNRTLEPIQIGELTKASKDAGVTDPSMKVITDPAQQLLGQETKALGKIDTSDDQGMLKDIKEALGEIREMVESTESPVASVIQESNGSAVNMRGKAAGESGRDGFGAEQGEGALFIKKMTDKIEKAMASLIQEGLVAIQRSDLWVEVEIKTSVLFASGSARLQERAEPILIELGEILREYDVPIRVEGFTDNVPINTLAFPSNWELSAARAASVVHLFTRTGVEPHRLAAIGYGEYRPIADNATEEGRTKNRRVVLVILQSADAERLFSSKHNGVRSAENSMASQKADITPQLNNAKTSVKDNTSQVGTGAKGDIQGKAADGTIRKAQDPVAIPKRADINNEPARGEKGINVSVNNPAASERRNAQLNKVGQPPNKMDATSNAIQLPVVTQPLELPLLPQSVISVPKIDSFIKHGEQK